MGRTRRLISAVLTLAAVLSLLPATAVSAEEPVAEPAVFDPTIVDTTDTTSSDPLGEFKVKSRKNGELVELRRATSRTFAEDGQLKTVVWPGPVNYLDADGTYKSIDNTLLLSAGGGIVNTANSYRVNFPAELATTGTTIAAGGHQLSYKVRDVAPTLGVVDEDAVDYEEPMPGVHRLQYRAENARVTQGFDVIVDEAPETVTYEVTMSPGLTATQTDTGDVVFVDPDGQVAVAFVDPMVEDPATGMPLAVEVSTPNLVVLDQVEDNVALIQIFVQEILRSVGCDPLGDASTSGVCNGGGSVGPIVTVRPGFSLSPWQDCILISDAPNDTFCGYANLDVGATTDGKRRTVIDFQIDRAGLPETAEVLFSRLSMYRYDYDGLSSSATMDVHPMTRGWSTATTWNTADGLTRWTNPGGDFAPDVAASTTISTTNQTWVDWYPTSAVRDWVLGEADDFGFMVKKTTDSAGLQRFISGNYVRQAYWPYLEVVWEPRMGTRSDYSFEEWQLTDRITAKVNVGSGNLLIEQRDLTIPGTGLDLTLDRVFNSVGVYSTELGARWAFDTARDVGLRKFPDGSVAFYGPGFDVVAFDANPDGSFTSPGDANATLTKTTSGYELNFHRSDETWRFNDGGFFLERVDKNGNRISFAYDSYGRLTTITDTQGRVTTFTHKKDDLVSITDPAGRTFGYRYADGGLVEYIDPAGQSTFYKYEGDLDLRSITDPSGRLTEFTYDTLDRVTSMTRYEGKTADSLTSKTWRFTYDDTNHVTRVTDPNGHTTTYHHDTRARVDKVVDARGNERATSYDSNSNVTDYTTAAGTQTIFEYDTTTNNLTSATLPTGASTKLFYDDPAHPYLPTKQTDTQNNDTTYSYDAAGNPDLVTDATGAKIDHDYNPDGTLARKTDANGNVTTYTYRYTASGVLETVTVDHPAPLGDETRRYDLLGRLISATDGNGRTTSYRYDALDRPTETVYADGATIVFGYDPAGNRTSMTDQLGSTSYGYDGMARLVSEQLATGQTNTYTYDPVGNLLTHTDPNGTTTYTYNEVNLAASVTDPAGNATKFDYDSDNRRTATRYPNQVVMQSDYDDSGRLERIWSTGPAGTLTDFSYSYAHPTTGADTALRWSMTDASRSETTAYGYTPVNRLDAATLNGPAGTTSYGYGYDPNGNRTAKTVNGATTSYSYNAANQLTHDSTGTTYSYDGAGNLTGSSDGTTYTYNAKNQTTSITPAGSTAVPFSYTGPSQVGRVAAGGTDFALTILGTTRTSGGQTASYTRDPSGGLVSTTRGSATYYYLFDGLGSVVGLTDTAGELVNEYRYTPYGLTTLERETIANPWRFTGEHYDHATGLYKIGHRYYDPALGRWTQRDPSNAELNPYLYSAGNPVNYTDPSGLHWASWLDISSLVLGIAAGIAGFYGASALSAGLTLAGVAASVAGAVLGPCVAEGLAFELGYALLGSSVVGAMAEGGAKALSAFVGGFLSGLGYSVDPC